MKRQKFSREYKLEAVKQVRERDVSAAQVARDLGIGANVVSRWVREASGDVRRAFPRQGQQPAEQAEIERLKREIVKLKAEKGLLKKGPFLGINPINLNDEIEIGPGHHSMAICAEHDEVQVDVPLLPLLSKRHQTKWKHWPQTATKRDCALNAF